MDSCDQRMDVNCDPLSDVICSGVPNRLTQFCSSARARESADVSLTGMASGHRVNRSTTVRRCENPWDGGKGPTTSTCTWLKRRDYDRKFRTRDSPLRAANNTDIASFGERTKSLKLGTNTLCWKFNVADVSQPILGADFLCHHGLLVDVRRRRLINAETFETTEAFSVSDKVPIVSVVKLSSAAQDFERLIDERAALTCPTFSNATPRHGVEHHILTEGAPVFARTRRLSPEKLAYAKKEFDEMEAMGIVRRRSSSPWSSPLHVIPEPSGGWRPCGDYRLLNPVTVDDRYPVPRLQDFTATLAGKTMFSKIDLVRAYHQVPMTPNDIPKTAVITPLRLYEFLRVPFGLKNAAQAFQRLMDKVCQGLARVFVYLDDILVASEDRHQHLRDLTELFGRLEDHGLVRDSSGARLCVNAAPNCQKAHSFLPRVP